MDDFNVIVLSHEGRHFGIGTIYKPQTPEQTDAYIAQVLNAMIHYKLVTQPDEALICLAINVATGQPHFSIITRTPHMPVNKDNIIEVCKEISSEGRKMDEIPIFNVICDMSKPISYYKVPKTSVESTLVQFETMLDRLLSDYPDITVGHMMTIKK